MQVLEQPRPAARFWDRIADRYAAKPVPDEHVYERKLAITRALLTPDARVLELGCGTGSTALALAAHAGHILATDISPRMVAIAEEKRRTADVDNVAFRRASVEDLRPAAGSVDVILAHSLLHLLEDWRDVITTAHAALAPGGALVTTTACLADGFGWLRLIAPAGRGLGLLPHLGFFSREALETTLVEAGFSLERAWMPGRRRGVFHVARKPR